MLLKIIFTTFVLLCVEVAFSQEICDNNIDDDGDRKIDLFDVEDCPCNQDSLGNSLISNGSFENVSCIAPGYSYLNCADGWMAPTFGTSDLFMPNSFFPAFIPTPVPDGNNCAGFIMNFGYNEYISTCLTEPMRAGESYILQFDVAASFTSSSSSPQAYLALFGKPECDTIHLDNFGCLEQGNWSEIGRVTYLLQNEWSKVEMLVELFQDVSEVSLGPSCQNTPVEAFFLVDNLKLAHTSRKSIYHIPNAFTPNGDEFNQQFKPVFVCGFDESDYLFEVYNRWGELVFASFDVHTGWDGTYNGQLAEGGLFGWKITYKNEKSARREVITGSVSLLK